MATTLPDDATKANSDSTGDDPKQSLTVDLPGVIDMANDLKAALGAAAQLNLNGQFGTMSQTAPTPNDLRLLAPYAAKADNYTALAGDIGKLLDFTVAGKTLSLAAAATLGADWWCEFRNSSAGNFTIDPNGSELVDGVTSKSFGAGAAGKIVCTGAGFVTVGGTGGGVLQVQYFHTGASTEPGGTIPVDNSVPTSSEGAQFFTLAITPKSATSTLLIDVTFIGSTGTNVAFTVALFKNSETAALKTAIDNSRDNTNLLTTVNLKHEMVSGTTSTITFRVRAGGASGTLRMNGFTGALMNGTLASGIRIMEIAN